MRVHKGRYPVGIQTFSDIIERNCLYADKTALVHDMASSLKYVFLSRPRRFGKSLLCSTLESYFSGERELFEGLAIERLETQWRKHPVIDLSLAAIKENEASKISSSIDNVLSGIEKNLGLSRRSEGLGNRLKDLITGCAEQTGERAVVIVDEYDAPLLNVLHDPEQLTKVRQIMRTLFSPLKDCDPFLRFVFITGITKFSQLSIFSELNNLKDITMERDYGALCGITQNELETTFSMSVDDLAEEQSLSREVALGMLRDNYDGYCFAANAEGVYNPFSLLNSLQDRRFKSYWFATGTPTYLLEQLRHFKTDVTTLDGSKAPANEFDAPTEAMTSVLPLMYQSGYLTIKDYNREFDIYTLGIPNREVRTGLMGNLVKLYATPEMLAQRTVSLTDINTRMALVDGNIDIALETLKNFFAQVPYQDDVRRKEGYYRGLLYVTFSMLGVGVDSEVRTSSGRVDVVAQTSRYVYVIECKIDSSAAQALEQINQKGYAQAWAADKRKVVKVGINFSTESGTIDDWCVENL